MRMDTSLGALGDLEGLWLEAAEELGKDVDEIRRRFRQEYPDKSDGLEEPMSKLIKPKWKEWTAAALVESEPIRKRMLRVIHDRPMMPSVCVKYPDGYDDGAVRPYKWGSQGGSYEAGTLTPGLPKGSILFVPTSSDQDYDLVTSMTAVHLLDRGGVVGVSTSHRQLHDVDFDGLIDGCNSSGKLFANDRPVRHPKVDFKTAWYVPSGGGGMHIYERAFGSWEEVSFSAAHNNPDWGRNGRRVGFLALRSPHRPKVFSTDPSGTVKYDEHLGERFALMQTKPGALNFDEGFANKGFVVPHDNWSVHVGGSVFFETDITEMVLMPAAKEAWEMEKRKQEASRKKSPDELRQAKIKRMMAAEAKRIMESK